MQTKKCTGCGQEKELREFYFNETTCSFKSKCNICSKQQRKEWYKKNPNYNKEWYKKNPYYNKKYYIKHRDKYIQQATKWYKKNTERAKEQRKEWYKNNPNYHWNRDPQKIRARNLLNSAITSGKVIRQPCEKCGNLKADGHHDSYDKPLDVRWLCEKCHIEHHKWINRTQKWKIL